MRRKIAHGLFRFLIYFFNVLIALAFILLILGVWRLSKEPVELKGLTPILSSVLTPEKSDLSVSMDKAYLVLALKRGTLLDIKVTNLVVTRPDGSVMVSIPEGNVSLSLWGLMKGEFVPTAVYLYHPYAQLVANNEKSRKTSQKDISEIIQKVLSLDDFVIEQGKFIFDEEASKTNFDIPKVDFVFERNSRDEMQMHSLIDLYINNRALPLYVTGLYNTKTKHLTFEADYKELDVPTLAFMIPALKKIDLNVSGQLRGELDLSQPYRPLRQLVEELSFSATLNKKGSLYLPRPLDIAYQLDNMAVQGSFSPSLETMTIQKSLIDIGGPTVEIDVKMTGLDTLLDTGSMDKTDTVVTATVMNVPIDSVPDVWPSALGAESHAWVKQNVRGGMVEKSDFVLTLKGGELTAVKGLLDIQDSSVRYMDDMPKIEQVAAKVLLQLGRVDIEATAGKTDNINLQYALIDLTNLLTDNDSQAHVEIKADAPLNEVLNLINNPSLRLADEFHIKPHEVKGQGEVSLMLDFPMGDEVQKNEIRVAVQAALTDTQMPVPDTEMTLTNGRFDLTIDNDVLTIQGAAMLANTFDSQIACTQNFTDRTAFDTKCTITSAFDGKSLDSYPLLKGAVTGKGKADVTITELADGTARLDVYSDLTSTLLDVWPIAYTKEAGEEASVAVSAVFKNDKLQALPVLVFSVPKKNVLVQGQGHFNGDTDFRLTSIRAPRNDATLTYKKTSVGTIVFDVQGKSLDLSKAFGRTEPSQSSDTPMLRGTIELDNVYLTDKPLSDVSVELEKRGNFWWTLDAKVKADNQALSINLDNNKLKMSSGNIGAILSRAGLTQRLSGGVLTSSAKQDAKGNLTGEIKIKNYRLTNVSFLMKAATILGVVDAFINDTIEFKKATIPFNLSADYVLTITDAVASGNALGLTAKGTLSADKLNLKGSVIPAYAVNSLPGKIPLIGRLFSGDKGGGLFGVSYDATGSVQNPIVNFYPSSLLTPGIIRNIFN